MTTFADPGPRPCLIGTSRRPDRTLAGVFVTFAFYAVASIAVGGSVALGTRTLGLFPPVKPIDIARWGALGRNAVSLSGEQACDSCTGAGHCRCMEAIGAGQVAQVIAGWRAAEPPRQRGESVEEAAA